MSDYEDYGDEDIIDYDENEYLENAENEINYEDIFLEASTSKDISKFNELIELEKDNSTSCDYSFKAYNVMCTIYIEQKQIEDFVICFKKLIDLYPKVEYNNKKDTMRDINFTLTCINDYDYLIDICRIVIDNLFDKMHQDKSIARELLNTGILFSKTLILLEKYDTLGELLEEMFDIMDRLNVEDDDTMKDPLLEFIVFKILYCNIKNKTNEATQLYFKAETMNKNKINMDNSLSSVINEQGGKLYMSQRNYEKALEKFKQAFYNYQESGNHEKAKTMFKYSILNSLIARNSHSVVSNEEAKLYTSDDQLSSLIDLKKAYESANINLINEIWNERIKKKETDEFIINQLNEILHEIRFNYIKIKLSAYKVCKFETLRKELGVDLEYLVSILLEIASTEVDSVKINFTKQSVYVYETMNDNELFYENINMWINKLNNQ